MTMSDSSDLDQAREALQEQIRADDIAEVSVENGSAVPMSDDDLTELIGELIHGLADRGETVATAESLTGGLIGAWITAAAGASDAYRGGVVSYATDLKGKLLGVSERTLAEHGAVSQLTAVEMALGVAQRCEASWGIAVTGVAGPAEQEGNPPGTVYVAVARRPSSDRGWDDQQDDSVVCVRKLSLDGDRAAVRNQTVAAALRQARQVCLG